MHAESIKITSAPRSERRRLEPVRRHAARGALRVCALVCAAIAVPVAAHAAATTPGGALRDYLAARWAGNLAGAEALWDADDMRRSVALGTKYPALEARYDDNLLWSPAERQAKAAGWRAVVRDSSVEAAWARYTVLLQPQSASAPIDTVAYGVRKTGAEWRVTSLYAKVAAGWATREGRYVRIYASKLRDVNDEATAALDAGLQRALDRLGTPETARLRLERLKIHYYLCDSAAEMRQLGLRPNRDRYRLAGERVVTRDIADLNALCRPLVNLSLSEAAPSTAPFFSEGLAAAIGGAGNEAAGVVLQRGAAATVRPGSSLDVFDAGAFTGARAAKTVPVAALWNDALLRDLGAERYLTLYRNCSGDASRVAALDAAAVRGSIEKATGKSGAALESLAKNAATAVPAPLAGGCTQLPEETRERPPVLRWRDAKEEWSLEIFDTGDTYTVVVQPYGGPMPKWAQKLVDSLSAAPAANPAPAARPRPPGDPPQLAVLIRERLFVPTAYESALFASQFSRRKYASELFGLFISPDEARLYDYRRDAVEGLHSADVAPPAGPAYYDEKAGRICFRLRRDLLPKPFGELIAVTLVYTGE